MIFNAQQVTDIVSILQRHQLTFIAKQLGLNYLSPTDRAILTAAGVDLNQFTNSQGIVEQAYLFGLLSEALGDERSKGMDYKQFQKFIKSGQFVPLTEEEKFVLEQVKNQSYNDISGLGSKIIQGTRNIVVRANLRQQNKIRNIIKKKAIDAVQFRQSAAKMASEIGHATGDWERDWLRIAYYVLQNSYNYGRARAIFRDHGDDAEVYFDVLKGACQHCRELYLTDPDDEDSAPKIFKLKDILANGNNIGRKAADWLPTVSPIHPYCFNSPAVKIYTSRGWKKIKDIRVGDLVLTHKGRFKRVTQLHIRRCDDNERIYEIEYKTDNKNNGFVRRITGNHPVLTSRGWKRVDELTVSDKLFTPTFICQECGDKIRISCFNDSSLSLICLNCRRKGSAINQWKNEDFREYMSVKTHEQMLERYKNMSYEDRLRISDKARKTLAEKYKDGHPWMVEAIKKANKTNGKKKTFIERKLLYFCERLGVKTITNMCLKNRNNRFRNKAKCYFPDIFIPSLGIILEADGMQWHKDKKYDENRDKDIKDIWGFDTFRFSEDDIVNHGDEVFNELQRLFNNHRGNYGIKVTEIVSIKRVKTVVIGKDRNLYNFSVEDDESYIADGIVVHNCRCSVRYKDPNMEWDASTLSYTKPKKYVPKNKKLRNIKLNIKVSKAKEDLINSDIDFMLKAHQVGDIHPNEKWIWTEYAPGKFDWRGKNGKYYKNRGSAAGDQINKPVKVSKFTPDELKEDESVLKNSPDVKMKKTLAAKYGVNSMKADDIRKEVLKNLNELHKTKTKFDDEDLKWFNKYWDYPASPQKLRLAFRDESDEFLEYYKGVREATYNAMPAGLRYNSMRGKSLEREIKALRDIVNDRKNDNDQELKELIKNLNKETKVFHDDYINRTEEYHSRYFDNLEQMKDFRMSDFMSFFGVMGELQYNHIAERMNKKHSFNSGLKSSEMNLWYKYHSDTSQPFTSDVKTITVWGKKIQPKEIHVADYTRSGENVHSDLPSKQALDYAGGVMMLKSNFGFDKKKYVTQMKLDAEKRYQSNMMIVADKVRQMYMNERNLSVKSIKTSVKGFDIVVSDGEKKIYARSIYAAENSVFVAPHFRFIVTDRTNMKVAKAQEDEFSQRLSQAKKDTNTKPTEAEIKAGNYKKGHVRFGGYEYVIENPKGSFRCGVDANGKKWKTKMNNTYGYFLGTLGKDKDHIDVFINDDVDLDSFNGKIYVIDQVNKDKTFDEHKVMYGFRNKSEAKKAYLSNYDKGWRGCGNITGVKKEVFDKWIRNSKRKVKPFADYVEIN